MRNQNSLVGFVLISALSVGLAAEQRGTASLVSPPPPAVKFTAPWRPLGAAAGDTKVIGTVIDIRQTPVKNATVRLRDLATGSVLATTTTNEQGEYAFVLPEPGTYIVEMIMVDGAVVALSNAGSLARYETLQTVVQLPGLWDSANRLVISANDATAFLGMSSASTMTATTITMATQDQVPAVNPGEPVSPH